MPVIQAFPTPVYIDGDAMSNADALAIRSFLLYHYKMNGSDQADEDLFNSDEANILCPQLATAQTVMRRAICRLGGVEEHEHVQLTSCKYNIMHAGEQRHIHMHHQADASSS